MQTEESIIDKLRLIQRLYEGSTTEGERVAAEEALGRLTERLKRIQDEDPPIEYKFTFPDKWRKRLFNSLLRRYGFKPYRYHGQRHTTVMVMISRTFVNETLWPEFQELSKALVSHLNEITTNIIRQAVYPDSSEANERPVLAG